jgi:hypothetical protein
MQQFCKVKCGNRVNIFYLYSSQIILIKHFSKFAKTSRHLDEQHASVASLFQFTNLRFFATTPDKPKTTDARPDNKLDQQRMGRSILEEVLIKEEEQPKTTAQKGNTYFCLVSLIYTIVSEEKGREHILLCGVSGFSYGSWWHMLFAF